MLTRHIIITTVTSIRMTLTLNSNSHMDKLSMTHMLNNSSHMANMTLMLKIRIQLIILSSNQDMVSSSISNHTNKFLKHHHLQLLLFNQPLWSITKKVNIEVNLATDSISSEKFTQSLRFSSQSQQALFYSFNFSRGHFTHSLFRIQQFSLLQLSAQL